MNGYEIVPFAFQGKEIRTFLDTEGNGWLVLADLARVLGYKNLRKAGQLLKNHGLNYAPLRSVIPKTGSRGRPATAWA